MQLTRSVFDIFNCSPTTPPGKSPPVFLSQALFLIDLTHSDGYEYLQVVIVRCYEEGGLHVRLLPFAILFFFLYTLAFPTVVALVLVRNKEKIKADQILRAHGFFDNDSRKHTPLYTFHVAFRRLCMWLSLLLHVCMLIPGVFIVALCRSPL